ncbi:MAG: hypothetical protein IJM36_05840 [Acholeplasmatales bacterium]|nr:hypothetical protein [Acholeplasmatales bacterium]
MHSQCLMCKYSFGRKCRKNNERIPDDIYNNLKKCADFHSLQDTEIEDPCDSCCNENKDYYKNN